MADDKDEDPNWVRVVWDSGSSNSYRWGQLGKHDLEVVSPGSVDAAGTTRPTSTIVARLKQIGTHGTVELSANGLSVQTRDGFPTVARPRSATHPETKQRQGILVSIGDGCPNTRSSGGATSA